MNVSFDRSFYKSLDKLSDADTKERVAGLIEQVEAATTLSEIPHLKKMEGFKTFYRIRLGDYRVGVELEPGGIVRFIIVAHRKDIYRLFP
jgi:mRNA interferase RelE/StbE